MKDDLTLSKMARTSADEDFLRQCLDHKSGYVQVAVAMNQNLSPELLNFSLNHPNSNVIAFELLHKKLSKQQFDFVYDNFEGKIFDPKVHPQLVCSEYCEDSQLVRLAEEYGDKYLLVSEVLGQLRRRGEEVRKRLAKPYLPPENKINRRDSRDWTEEEAMAYLVYHDRRTPES